MELELDEDGRWCRVKRSTRNGIAINVHKPLDFGGHKPDDIWPWSRCRDVLVIVSLDGAIRTERRLPLLFPFWPPDPEDHKHNVAYS